MVLKISLFFAVLYLSYSCKPSTKACDNCTEVEVVTGQTIYQNRCISCHGENGDLGNSGAKDLTKSSLSDTEIIEILSEGKGAMPPILELVEEPIQMDSVIQYIKKLRKK